jgi:ATP-dependent Clp protease ATP-binding subunit ClpC
MFEAFDEHARRALFFARWSLTQTGGETIDDVHLLHGILTARPEALTRFTDRDVWPAAALEQRMRELFPGGPPLPVSAEIPFSRTLTERLLAVGGRAREPGAPIVPEHLLWALLQPPVTPVTQFLAEAGVSVQAVDAFLDGGR